jgi:hypothetical protein
MHLTQFDLRGANLDMNPDEYRRRLDSPAARQSVPIRPGPALPP